MFDFFFQIFFVIHYFSSNTFVLFADVVTMVVEYALAIVLRQILLSNHAEKY